MIFPVKFDVASLNGTNGFVFIGDTGDYCFGMTIANIGDINNDGKKDFIVGAFSNQAYILFGAENFSDKVYASNLNGTNGFRIIGASQIKELGYVVAGLGDINMDGIDDFIVATHETPEAFIIFGANSFPSRISLVNLNGKTGFKIVGKSSAFYTACGIGDVNGDGKSDFILSNALQQLGAGGAYVIYGAQEFPIILNVTSDLNGRNGFTIISERVYAGPVLATGVGDFNGDTKPDFVTGVLFDPDHAYYVIYGADRFPPVFYTSSLNGTNGFTIIGMTDSNEGSIAKLADINGDHLPDLGIGLSGYNNVYIIFGSKHFNATFDAANLDGSNGVKLVGPFLQSDFGFSIADVESINHNGKSGIIVGAPQTGLNGQTGSAYVFFGSDHFPPELHTSYLNGTNGFEVVGPLNAELGSGVSGIDNFTGNGKPAIAIVAPLHNAAYIILDASMV